MARGEPFAKSPEIIEKKGVVPAARFRQEDNLSSWADTRTICPGRWPVASGRWPVAGGRGPGAGGRAPGAGFSRYETDGLASWNGGGAGLGGWREGGRVGGGGLRWILRNEANLLLGR